MGQFYFGRVGQNSIGIDTDAPWIFLATEKLVYARKKKLSDFYVMPDGSFEFSHADMK